MSRVDPDRQRPIADLPENRGLYLFLVRLHETARVKIGALGQHRLDAGWYVYTGHARRNLVQRVQRHFKPRKRVRWHIDRLVELGRATFDESERLAIYGQLQKALHEREPITCTFNFASPVLYDDRLSGVTASPLGVLLTTDGPSRWRWTDDAAPED